jgi:cell fate regulator YaaT (PSP1 superfamily)
VSAVHLVRVGLLGRIGRFVAANHRYFDRDTEVVVRTSRGLEVGEVICALEFEGGKAELDGELLRQLGREDRAIAERIDRFRDKAFVACQSLLSERQLKATLVDVEHLFDGQSIWFYFLGEVSPDVEALTNELAETYESKVKFRKFAETLANGCGPECGTGVSCGSCSGCAVGGCGVRAKPR